MDDLRFETPMDVYAEITQMRTYDNSGRSQMRATIQGLIDGNAPYTCEQMQGRKRRSNVNWGEARSIIRKAKQPYYNLLTSSPTYITAKCTYSKSDIENQSWGITFSNTIQNLFEEWGGYIIEVQKHHNCMIAQGLGPIYWQDSYDWRFLSGWIGNFLFPENSSADLGRLNHFAVKQEYYPFELYNILHNSLAMKDKNWNRKALFKSITDGLKGYTNEGQDFNFDQLQQWVKNHALNFYQSKNKVTCWHFFNRSLNGKISHKIIRDDASSDFLYRKRDKYNSFKNVICLFPQGLGEGDGSIHSIRGLGYEIFSICKSNNILMNKFRDNVDREMTPYYRTQNAGGAKQIQLIQMEDSIILPAGVDFAENRPNFKMDSGFAYLRESQMQLRNQTQAWNQAYLTPGGESPTATQFQGEQIQGDQLTNSQVALYLRQWDDVDKEIVRRLLDIKHNDKTEYGRMALKFKGDLLKAKIPEHALKSQHWDIKATRIVGGGDKLVQITIADKFMQNLGAFDPSAQVKIKRNWVNTVSNPQMGKELVPESKVDYSEMEQFRQIEEEQAMMISSLRLISVLPVDMHWLHIPSHLQEMDRSLQDQVAFDKLPERLLYLDLLGAHTVQHMNMVANETANAQQLKIFNKELTRLSGSIDQLRRGYENMVKEQAQAQNQGQPQQEEMTESQVKSLEKLQTNQAEFQQKLQQKQAEFDQKQKQREASHKQRTTQRDQANANKLINQTQMLQAEEGLKRAYPKEN